MISVRFYLYCKNSVKFTPNVKINLRSLFLTMSRRRNQGSKIDYSEAGSSRSNRHPQGLKGKEIGLWYAQRKKRLDEENPNAAAGAEANTAKHNKKMCMRKLMTVTLDPRRMERIQALLNTIETPHLTNLCVQDNDNHSTIEEKYSHLSSSHFKDNFLRNITGNIQTKIEEAAEMRKDSSRDPILDASLKEDLVNRKETNIAYQRMLEFRKRLPSYSKEQEILNLIRNNQVILISGETGCGKTTQVAQFILDDCIMRGEGSTCHVVCTQPRRISAISVAHRVADERGESIGAGSVGYQIRLEARLPKSKKGSILFCTTGILLQWMRSDPGLVEVSHLILDEIHERDVLSDFIITILKDVLPKRPDLKLILMSATLNAEQFSKYYNHCPMIHIPGFTYPVEEFYLEDILQFINFSFPQPAPVKNWMRFQRRFKDKFQEKNEFENIIQPYIRDLRSRNVPVSVTDQLINPESENLNIELISELINYVCLNKGPGAILVFLPGWQDISKLHSALRDSGRFPEYRYLIIPLHSLMPTALQKTVFDRPPPGVRKIVIATNIAETSITIDDVVYVIDCGKIKMKNFDSVNNIGTLKAEWVSLANARQRRGRAGRVQPGVCYHLFTRAREMALASYQLPEILRTRLEEVILQLKILQIGKTEPFLERVMDPPDKNVVHLSLKLLRNLNALDAEENLTPLGYHLTKLPVDPQMGKMILMASIFSCIDPVFTVAACLSFKDPFFIPLGKESLVNQRKAAFAKGCKSDHLTFTEVMRQWEEACQNRDERSFCYNNFLSSNTLHMLRDMKKQFAKYLHEMNFLSSDNVKSQEANVNSNNVSLVRAIICSGLYPNVAFVRNTKLSKKSGTFRSSVYTNMDGRVEIHPKSVNAIEHGFESPFLVYYEKLKLTSKFLFDTGMVYPLPLLFFGEGIKLDVQNGKEVVSINDWISFQCKESDAIIIQDLRTKLDKLLESKITHPGGINWQNDNEEASLLRAIIELITIEERMIVTGMDEDDYDDFED